MNNALAPLIQTLRDPATIRIQAKRMLDRAKENRLEHFSYNPAQLIPTASFVIDVISTRYPTLHIPYHSRWRHFEAGGIDRIHIMQKELSHLPPAEQGKILYELVIISVFLDAGAGSAWSYQEPGTNKQYTRSEGLALACLNMYQNGILSAHQHEPLRIDAQRLIEFTATDLSHSFQITSANPLAGLAGRVALLNRLGHSMKQKTQYFGTEGRLGDFYCHISALATINSLAATQIFQAVLDAFNESSVIFA